MNQKSLVLLFLQLSLITCITLEKYEQNYRKALQSIPNLDEDVIVSNLAAIKELNENRQQYNEDVYLNISQLITKYGYGFEDHKVTTEDGYVLSLHRIPGKGPPVFIMHGILASSDDFVVAGPESATSYHLSNEGYDVWLGNARGVKHSRQHITMSPEDPKFWDFSFHEIGIYDLPASIDYVLTQTKQKKLNYIGYSQGSTSFFIMCSELPEYCGKISINIVLSPVAWMTHMASPIFRIAFDSNIFAALISAGQPEVFASTALGSSLCSKNNILKLICSNFLLVCFGFDRGQMNVTNLPVILSHTPSGCSAKQFEHYRQAVYSEKFSFFDYGIEGNIKLYGSKEPPDYKLNRTATKTALFYSYSDWISSIIDVERIRKSLPNVVEFYEAKNFGHIDYLYGKNLRVINNRIVSLIKKFWEY